MTQPSNSNVIVFIVDDDPSIRKALAMAVASGGMTARAFPSADAFLEVYDSAVPGCLILDLSMPGSMDGLALLEALRARAIEIPVLIVTANGNVPSAVRTMKLGAIDFLEKPADPQTVLHKVREAVAGDVERRAERLETQGASARLAGLTPREWEVLERVVSGLSNKQIASEMDISIKTVENHRANLMAKADATNTADLVRMRMTARNAPERSAKPE